MESPGTGVDRVIALLSRHLPKQDARIGLQPARYPNGYFRIGLPASLGTAIRIARQQQGMTQKDLATAMTPLLAGDEGGDTPNVTSWVSKAEQKASPALGRFAAVAAATGLPPSLLLCGAGDGLPTPG